MTVLWEAPFARKIQEQGGEAEAGRAGLVGQEREIVGEQRPLLDQVVSFPLSLHSACRLLSRRSWRYLRMCIEVPRTDGVGY